VFRLQIKYVIYNIFRPWPRRVSSSKYQPLHCMYIYPPNPLYYRAVVVSDISINIVCIKFEYSRSRKWKTRWKPSLCGPNKSLADTHITPPEIRVSWQHCGPWVIVLRGRVKIYKYCINNIGGLWTWPGTGLHVLYQSCVENGPIFRTILYSRWNWSRFYEH